MNINEKFYQYQYTKNDFSLKMCEIQDYCIANNLCLEDGEDENGYYVVIHEQSEDDAKQKEINRIKAELSSYDYIGVKIAMGVATAEEYADKIAYTQTLRARINELQNSL